MLVSVIQRLQVGSEEWKTKRNFFGENSKAAAFFNRTAKPFKLIISLCIYIAAAGDFNAR